MSCPKFVVIILKYISPCQPSLFCLPASASASTPAPAHFRPSALRSISLLNPPSLQKLASVYISSNNLPSLGRVPFLKYWRMYRKTHQSRSRKKAPVDGSGVRGGDGVQSDARTLNLSLVNTSQVVENICPPTFNNTGVSGGMNCSDDDRAKFSDSSSLVRCILEIFTQISRSFFFSSFSWRGRGVGNVNGKGGGERMRECENARMRECENTMDVNV